MKGPSFRATCTGLALVAGMLAGCSGKQSALAPAGTQAGQISGLWWLFFSLLSVAYVVVIALLLVVTFRRQHQPLPEPILSPDRNAERIKGKLITGAVVTVIIILFVFLVGDFATGRTIEPLQDPDPLRIKITGHQWWWEVEYQGSVPSQNMTTANEIHLPTGKPVLFELQSPDVIHSFWAPNFHGKKDLVPGHPTTLWFRAEREGTFFGQCAEFCGAQHAHMRFWIVSEAPAQFQNWLESQRQLSAAPGSDGEKAGQAVFLSGSCALCHTISGTDARGRVGPDLTHLASRTRLAAGTLTNLPSHLAGWVLDPQRIKPGVRMPQHNLGPEDLKHLLEYLQSLH